MQSTKMKIPKINFEIYKIKIVESIKGLNMSTSPNKFANIIRFSIGVLVLFMWAVIGLLFWIPLLARAIAYYCGFVVLSSFQEANLDAPLKLLNFSIEFYPSGFNKIFHSFYENPQPFQNNYPKSKLSLDIKD